jgi:3-deoxy-7-phosphoheptulonate synthase
MANQQGGDPFRRVSKATRPDGTRVLLRGPRGAVELGGRFAVLAGPCAVESPAQLQAAARAVVDAGGAVLRGGAFKPRTSPYAFQGLEEEGVRLLMQTARRAGLPCVSEIVDAAQLGLFEGVDVLQVGARNMHNFALLKALGRERRPVLLKRGFCATVDEWLLAAEYLLEGGNDQVVLCERGIRTFETATRSTLDLGAVVVAKQRTHLPVIVDPSHAAGRRELVIPLSLAAAAAGADGLLVEVHPAPDEALCDGPQALRPDELRELVGRLGPLLASQGRELWRAAPAPVAKPGDRNITATAEAR